VIGGASTFVPEPVLTRRSWCLLAEGMGWGRNAACCCAVALCVLQHAYLHGCCGGRRVGLMWWRWPHSTRHDCLQFRFVCCVYFIGATVVWSTRKRPLWPCQARIRRSVAASQCCGNCCRAPAAEAEAFSMYAHMSVYGWCVFLTCVLDGRVCFRHAVGINPCRHTCAPQPSVGAV
jgi:hypothetical protein